MQVRVNIKIPKLPKVPKIPKVQDRRTATILALGILILIVWAVGSLGLLTHNADSLPPQIRTKLTFSPFVLPTDAKDFTASDYKFSTAEGNVQILSYLIHAKSGTTISLSEYTQPPQFTEIPEYKDRFLTNVAQQYDTVQTSNDTIYLGRLSRQNNRQLGIMLERGLLVFMSPDKEMSKVQWHDLGDQLEIQKVIN